MKKAMKLSSKMKRIMLPLFGGIMILIMVFSYFTLRSSMTESINDQLLTNSHRVKEYVESWTDQVGYIAKVVKGTIDNAHFTNLNDVKEYLKSTPGIHESLKSGFYGADANNHYIDGSGWAPSKDSNFVATERNWYKEGMVHGSTPQLGSVYVDAKTNETVVSMTCTAAEDFLRDFVLSVDVFLGDLSEGLKEADSLHANDSFIMIVEKNQEMIIACSNTDYVGYELSQNDNNVFMASIYKEMNVSEFTSMLLSSDKGKYDITLDNIEGTNWVVITAVNHAEAFAKLYKMGLVYIIMAVIVIAVAGFAITKILSSSMKPVENLAGRIGELSEGDLTVQVEAKGNDEIAVLASSFNDYTKSMREVMKTIISISEELKNNAGITNSTSTEMLDRADVQAGAMKEMGRIVEELSRAIDEIAHSATKLAQAVDDSTKNATEANKMMEDVVGISERGYGKMDEVRGSMETITEDTRKLAEIVNEVGNAMNEINDIINLIRQIANRTNLLSLNASIEAARAGEQGRGFAVVADEIGKLAYNSAESTGKIADIINNVNELVMSMVERTKGNVEIIGNNAEAVSSAYDAFGEICDTIKATSVKTEKLLVEIEKVNDVASNMAAISEEQSAGAEQILKNVEDMKKTAEDVALESKKLKECAGTVAESASGLAKNVDGFKI